jgi:hypothetical protein
LKRRLRTWNLLWLLLWIPTHRFCRLQKLPPLKRCHLTFQVRSKHFNKLIYFPLRNSVVLQAIGIIQVALLEYLLLIHLFFQFSLLCIVHKQSRKPEVLIDVAVVPDVNIFDYSCVNSIDDDPSLSLCLACVALFFHSFY